MEVFEIVPGLYQSRTPVTPEDAVFVDGEGHEVDIHAIVDLEGGIDPIVPQGDLADVYVYWPILDGPLPDEHTLRALGRFVSDLLDGGYKVLVHCHEGLNRASLVSGAALLERGLDPKTIVQMIRERRSHEAFHNIAFENWILSQEPRDQPRRANA